MKKHRRNSSKLQSNLLVRIHGCTQQDSKMLGADESCSNIYLLNQIKLCK